MKQNLKSLAEKYPKLWAAIGLFKRPDLRNRLRNRLNTQWDLWRLEGKLSRPFSLNNLLRKNPGLARYFLWDINPMLTESDSMWLHLGSGANILDGFINLDIAPQDYRVIKWNLLDLWPEELTDKVEGVFTEDCIEHFFMPNKSTFFATSTAHSSRPA